MGEKKEKQITFLFLVLDSYLTDTNFLLQVYNLSSAGRSDSLTQRRRRPMAYQILIAEPRHYPGRPPGTLVKYYAPISVAELFLLNAMRELLAR